MPARKSSHSVERALERMVRPIVPRFHPERIILFGSAARDLAYRLYGVCEHKKWSQEGLAYNTLVIAWPEIARLARAAPREIQPEMQL